MFTAPPAQHPFALCAAPRERDGELAGFAVYRYRPAMLLGDDVVAAPQPVPSAVGLVAKNGWNNLPRCSGEIPAPLSRTRISTASPRSRVGAPVAYDPPHGKR